MIVRQSLQRYISPATSFHQLTHISLEHIFVTRPSHQYLLAMNPQAINRLRQDATSLHCPGLHVPAVKIEMTTGRRTLKWTVCARKTPRQSLREWFLCSPLRSACNTVDGAYVVRYHNKEYSTCRLERLLPHHLFTQSYSATTMWYICTSQSRGIEHLFHRIYNESWPSENVRP